MKNQRTTFFILAIILFMGNQCSLSKKFTNPKAPKAVKGPVAEREFRAAWIASVANINWPGKPGLPVEQQKEEAIKLLDFLAENNFNAAILQVRPQCDALYQSELEPWSYYLSGTQGEAPDPYYDPLQFWIDEAHKRAIELHAWLNPYRAHHVVGGPVSDQSIVHTKPDHVVKLESGYYWMVPTDKETQDHSYKVVMDIVKRYDVDGIHFDDYFYPYPSYNNNKDFPDDESWAHYQRNGGKLERGDWRRDAVNTFMKRVYEGIKAEKKHVKFGLSPFGIWRPNNPPSIQGFDQYDKLYADAKLWLNEGWVDYWTPQLYWPINKIPQSFPVLLGWWNEQNYKNRHLWPGISLGRKSAKESADEAINQIMISRGFLANSPGIVHWNIGTFTQSPLLTSAVVEGPYNKKALVPVSPWLDKTVPDAPEIYFAAENDSLKLGWNHSSSEEIFAYVLYTRYGKEWSYDVLGRQWVSKMLPGYLFKNSVSEAKRREEIKDIMELVEPLHEIALTAVDKFGNESAVSQIDVSEETLKLVPTLGEFLENYPPEETNDSAAEVRALIIDIDNWLRENETVLKEVMSKVSAAGYNTVLLPLKENSESLGEAIEVAHAEELKVFVIIDDENKIPGQWLAKINLDGVVFDFRDYESIENTVVDILLLKPYLITAICASDPGDMEKAAALQAEGIVDLQLGDVGEYKAGEEISKSKEPAQFPEKLKRVEPGQVFALNLSAFLPGNSSLDKISINGTENRVIPEKDGWFKFISSDVDTLQIGINGETLLLPTNHWVLPYTYVVNPDGTVTRPEPWVEIRNYPGNNVKRNSFDLLCRTDPTYRGFVNEEEAKVYKTGVFFKTVELAEGANRIRVSALNDKQEEAFYELEIFRNPADEKRSPFPLWIEKGTVLPDVDLQLTAEDNVHVEFKGSKGQQAVVEVFPGGILFDCKRTDYGDYSTYRAELPLHRFVKNTRLKLFARLNDSLVFPFETSVIVKNEEDFPYVKTTEDNVRLTYNMGPVRLGGPVRAEYPKGIILQTNGRKGDYFRIRLNEIETGMIAASQVKELSAEFSQPAYYITNMYSAPEEGFDVLSIPYLNPIPYEVIPEPAQKRIVVRLFGAKTSSTWITHKSGLKVIDKLTWQQSSPDCYEVYINVKTPKIWGYEVKPDGKRLSIRLKHPPITKMEKKKPLTGLKIAIEAGHGGTSTGAIGLSGLQEKDINLDLSLQLGEICKSQGAEVVQVRPSDLNMSLLEKRDTAILSNADLLISIHANAAGGGFLRVSGTSMYYHNPFWAPLAENVYERLLETNLGDFGLIGSFNYTVIRTTNMPAVLVEQAFMSHAEDEEKLADPEFRLQLANKIYEGIVDYLEYMLK